MVKLQDQIRKILSVHKKILGRLEGSLQNWDEKCLIGRIFVDYKKDIEEAYPEFINDFPKTIEFIKENEASNGRFQAHLKLCEKNQDYGR